MTTRLRGSLGLIVAACSWATVAPAQSITLSSAPATLSVRTATPGSAPDAAVDVSTTYDLVITATGQRVVARLDEPLPPGVSLTIEVAAPAGAASAGRVPLGMLDREVVGAIPVPGTYHGLRITYRLTAAITAAPIPPSAGRVVFSVVDFAGRTPPLR